MSEDAIKPRLRTQLWDRSWREISGFKRSILTMAMICTVGGALWIGNDAVNGPKTQEVQKAEPQATLRSSFAGESTSTPQQYRQQLEETLDKNKWSGATTRFGFSFVIAFLVAVVLRIFIKTTVIIASVCAGTLAFAVNQGWIEPFWNEDLGFVETAAVWATAQTDSVIDFLKGYLPSSFSAGVGFAMGIRK